jgi:hypothetical protein
MEQLEWSWPSSMKKMRKTDLFQKFWKKCWRSGQVRLGCIHDEFWIQHGWLKVEKNFQKNVDGEEFIW